MSGDIETRLEELETLVEQQQETIERQRERIEELEGAGTDAAHEHGDTTPGVANDRPDSPAETSGEATAGGIDRRSAMKAGALLSLVGIGAGRAGASPTGQVGTSSRPLKRLYTQRLDGGVTGGQGLTDIAGTNLSIDSNGTLNASGGGGGISSLSGGNGIDPGTIADGDTLTVAWDDAASLDASGDIADFSAAADLDGTGNLSNFSGASDLDSGGAVAQLSGSLAAGQTVTDIAGTNLSIDSNGTLNASTSGGGISSLSGGNGIDPGTIADGDTLTVAWDDAASLDASGDIADFGAAANLLASGEISDFSAAASLNASGDISDFSSAASLDASGTVDAGRYLTTSSGTVDFNGPAEWSNAGQTTTNTVSGTAATVAGGERHEATSDWATVGGGDDNSAEGIESTVSGGFNNTASGDEAVIGGGEGNVVFDGYGTIGGGSNNQAGSDDGTANAEYATVPGGRGNAATGTSSLASGDLAGAADDYAFVWNDGTSYHPIPNAVSDGLSSNTAVDGEPVTGSNTFSVSATNGVRFITGGSNGNVSYIEDSGTFVPGGNAVGAPSGTGLTLETDDGSRALRLGVPTSDGTNTAGANVVVGHPSNSIENNAVGAVVAGGGNDETTGGGDPLGNNAVYDNYGTIGGGNGNQAGTQDSTVASPGATVAGGLANGALGEESVIGGGRGNVALGEYATIAGGANNEAQALGATVGGGGGVSSPSANRALGNYSTVAGGTKNDAGGAYATVGGGENSLIEAAYGTIAGGGPTDPNNNPNTTNNVVYDNYGTVGGGGENVAGDPNTNGTTNAPYATVGGGRANQATGERATVGGGDQNKASDSDATVGGGGSNDATSSGATIAGGVNHRASGTYAAITGGFNNKASARSASIGGGSDNTIVEAASFSTIAGGGPSDLNSPATTRNVVYDEYGTIGGGGNNQAGSDDGSPQNPTNAPYATVGGGQNNAASGERATVAGGNGNVASARAATVGGGDQNTADTEGATVAGGGSNGDNMASGTDAAVGGGNSNDATGTQATIPGGRNNAATGTSSLASGDLAGAANDYAFVWNDGSLYDSIPEGPLGLNSNAAVSGAGDEPTGANTFSASATGGVRFVTGSSSVTYIPSGSTGWSTASSRAQKTNVQQVDPEQALAGVDEMEVATWEYTDEEGSGNGRTHIGPMAEGFHAAFDLGGSDEHINTIDADGAAFAAIQGLSAKLDETRDELDERDDRIDELEAENERLREHAATLEDRLDTVESRLDVAQDELPSQGVADD